MFSVELYNWTWNTVCFGWYDFHSFHFNGYDTKQCIQYIAFKTHICFAEQTLFVKKRVMFVYHIEYNIHWENLLYLRLKVALTVQIKLNWNFLRWFSYIFIYPSEYQEKEVPFIPVFSFKTAIPHKVSSCSPSFKYS